MDKFKEYDRVFELIRHKQSSEFEISRNFSQSVLKTFDKFFIASSAIITLSFTILGSLLERVETLDQYSYIFVIGIFSLFICTLSSIGYIYSNSLTTFKFQSDNFAYYNSTLYIANNTSIEIANQEKDLINKILDEYKTVEFKKPKNLKKLNWGFIILIFLSFLIGTLAVTIYFMSQFFDF